MKISPSKTVKAPIATERHIATAVCVKGEVYGGRDSSDKLTKSVVKYAPAADAWSPVGGIPDDRIAYCACSFGDQVVVIGGFIENHQITIDTRTLRWQEAARMNGPRDMAACAAFEESVVASGGLRLSTVESYDVIADRWSRWPKMTRARYAHGMVAVASKLYAVGGGRDGSCEVFDKASNRFVAVNRCSKLTDFNFR